MPYLEVCVCAQNVMKGNPGKPRKLTFIFSMLLPWLPEQDSKDCLPIYWLMACVYSLTDAFRRNLWGLHARWVSGTLHRCPVRFGSGIAFKDTRFDTQGTFLRQFAAGLGSEAA